MVVGEFPPYCGGVGYYVYNLSKKLIKMGHKITILTRGYWNHDCIKEDFENIRVYKLRFIPLYPYHIRIHHKFLQTKFKSLENEFDLVHFHNPLVPFIETKLPKLLTEHGTVKAPIDNMESIGIHSFIYKLFSKELINQDKNVIKNVDIISAVSKSCSNDMNKFYGINKEIKIVYNGVDTEFFRPNEKSPNEIYILYTGRLYSGKGLMDLVNSAKFICELYPHIKFVLVGDGPLKKYLMRKIFDLNLENNFLFTGFLSRKDILKIYQNASIYVLPSYSEGFPTTLLESMSCGIASISTDIGGCSELIESGKNGILVPPKKPEILANVILNLLEDENLMYQIGKNAREHIIKNFDWEIIASKFEKIYENLIY
jgi:glycosyltransferase involved in cell wall biosynthesis